MERIDEFANKGWRKLAAQLAEGLILVEEITDFEIINFRKEQCLKCPNMDKENKMCGICKCFLSIKTKAKTNRTPNGIQVTHCPIGNWNDKEIADHYNSKK
jgi:hypothetical protein